MLARFRIPLVLLAHFTVFWGVNQGINPHPDMVDHWEWSRTLYLSYYEHPPMVAVIFRGITLLFGSAEWALELGAQLVNLSIIALAAMVAQQAFGGTSGWWTLLLLCGTPYFTLGSIFLHITQGLVLSWLIGLYGYLRYQKSGNPRWWLLIGVAGGLGALSKYVMILFYLGIGVHLLVYKDQRRGLLNPWLYAAGLLSLLIFAPVLVWNAQHDWVSFRWQLGRGTSGAEFGLNTLFFTVGHILLFSPVLLPAGVLSCWKLRERLRDSRTPEAVIFVLGATPLGFFTLASLKGSIADPHWANLSYLGLAMITARAIDSLKLKRPAWIITAGLFFNLLVVSAVLIHVHAPFHDIIPYDLENYPYLQEQGVPESVLEKLKADDGLYFGTQTYRKVLEGQLDKSERDQYEQVVLRTAMEVSGDRFTRVLGWQETRKQIERILREHNLGLPEYVVSREYQLSSAVAYYLHQQPWPHSIEKPERNQWSPEKAVRAGPSMFVCELYECVRATRAFNKRFGLPLKRLGEVIVYRGGRLVRDLLLYRIVTGE